MKLKKKIIYVYLLIVIMMFYPVNSFVVGIELKDNRIEGEVANKGISTSMDSEVVDSGKVGEETEPNTEILNLYAEAGVLVELSTGRIAYEKNADKQMYPASVTKIMTAILAVENCQLTDTVTITKDMISHVPAGYTVAYLRPGEVVTVEQLLNALLIPSANDAGFALAIHISGTVEDFATLMNQKATEIGCLNTNFTNPSGIHSNDHYTTATDMALIAKYALKYKEITDIMCTLSYDLQPTNSNKRTFQTTNTLIKPDAKTYFEYATGGKTGFTDQAGACIVATAKKENMEFLAVILNAPVAQNNIVYRDIDCKTLFEYGFENYEEIVKVEEPEVIFPEVNWFTTSGEKTENGRLSLSFVLRVSGVFLAIVLVEITVKHFK